MPKRVGANMVKKSAGNTHGSHKSLPNEGRELLLQRSGTEAPGR